MSGRASIHSQFCVVCATLTVRRCGLDRALPDGPPRQRKASPCSRVGSLLHARRRSAPPVARRQLARAPLAADLDTVTLDWAYYNPVSLVLKQEGWLEEELEAGRDRGPAGCRAWARTRRSSSSTPAASISARPPVPPPCWPRSTATRSRPSGSTPSRNGRRWSPGPTPASPRSRTSRASGSRSPRAPTRSSSCCARWSEHGLAPATSSLVLLQHDQGRLALERGDVDAWAGLDPMMADVELRSGYPAVLPRRRRQHLRRAQRARGVRGRASRDRAEGAGGLRARPAVGAGRIPASSPRSWPRPRSCPSRSRRKQLGRTAVRRPAAGRRAARRRSSPPGKALQGGRDHQARRRRRRHGRRAARAELRRQGRRRRHEHGAGEPARAAAPAASAAGAGRRAAAPATPGCWACSCRCAWPPSGSSPPGWAGSRPGCCRRPRRSPRPWPSCWRIGRPGAASGRHAVARGGRASRSGWCWRRCWVP